MRELLYDLGYGKVFEVNPHITRRVKQLDQTFKYSQVINTETCQDIRLREVSIKALAFRCIENMPSDVVAKAIETCPNTSDLDFYIIETFASKELFSKDFKQVLV